MTKMKPTYLLFLVLYIIGAMLLSPTSFHAQETTNPQPTAEGFGFEVIQPKNQRNKDVSYFDLTLAPGQKQTVQMKLTNTSAKEITIDVALTSAKTNGDGVIEYGPNNIPNDPSLKADFASVVKAPKKVTLVPNSEAMLDLEITMPTTAFKGVISGGIQLQDHNQVGKTTKEKQGMVVNKFAYLTGMMLSNESTDVLQPDLSLNSVYPKTSNYQNAIMVNFSNIHSTYVNGMTTEVSILGKKSATVLYSTKKTNMRMAPNSMIDFPVPLNGKKMRPGNYRAKILVTTEAGGHWEWEEPFTITKEEAETFNAQDLSLTPETGLNWFFMFLIAVGILFVFIIVFLILFILRKKKEEQEPKK